MRTTIIPLSVLTLTFIVVLWRYQLITSSYMYMRRPVSLVVVVNQSIDSNTSTPSRTVITLKEVIPINGRVGQLKLTSTTDRTRQPAHVSQTKTFGHFQFNYVINPVETCRSKRELESPVFLLNYVHSAIGNFARRARVRASWAHRSNYPRDRVETVFFVGLPIGDSQRTTQAAVEMESRQFRDIVQVNVIDSYR